MKNIKERISSTRLTHEIEQLRESMLSTALKEGLNTEETLTLSQNLDKLIINYQKTYGKRPNK